MAQQSICRGVATSVKTENGTTRVRYHGTVVAEWNAATITLNSGGWRTATTKTRINQASNQHSLGLYVFQSKGDWFVDYKGETLPFSDNMQLTR